MFTPKQRRKVFLKHIDLDSRLQPRDGLDEALVSRLMEAIENGAKLPPVAIFEVSSKNKLAGGRHRYEAHSRLGIKHIEADIYEGTFDDAWLFSRGDNNHGKALRNEEKERAVKEMLEKFASWSDRAIAAHLGVSQPFVGKIRGKSTDNGYQSNERTGRDGRTINTSNIGRSGPSSSDEYIASNPPNSTELESAPQELVNGEEDPYRTPIPNDMPPVADDDYLDEDPFADEVEAEEEQPAEPRIAQEFLVGDEVAGTTTKGEYVLGVVTSIYPDEPDGRGVVFVKGENHGPCYTDQLTMAYGRYLGGNFEPDHFVAWDYEGQTHYGRFIEYSSDPGRIYVADFFEPSKQYEPKVKELGVRRWTLEDRKRALAIRDGESEDSDTSEQDETESSDVSPEEPEPTIEEKIRTSPLGQALALHGHQGYKFVEAAMDQEGYWKKIAAIKAIAGQLRHRTNATALVLAPVARFAHWTDWEGCPACKGTGRFGARKDPCDTCKTWGFVIIPSTGVSADVVREHAENPNVEPV